MAKLATITVDNNGQVTVAHSDLPAPQQPRNPCPKKRIPSSPHKPVTTRNFYDLTVSETPTPVSSPGPASSPELLEKSAPGRHTGTRLAPTNQMDRENLMPGPFAQPHSQTRQKTVDLTSNDVTDRPQQGIRRGPVFIDPTTILPASSTLWKQSRVDIRKPSPPATDRSSVVSQANPVNRPAAQWGGPPRTVSAVPSRAAASPITMPSNPPRTLPPSFIHPDSLLQRKAIDLTRRPDTEPVMSQAQAEEALKSFFESALVPEDEDHHPKPDEEEEEAEGEGKVDGLYVTLMKHQIEGLKFLQDHECQEEDVKKKTGKGKGQYGGILADDMGLGKTIQTLALILTHPRPRDENQDYPRSTAQRCWGTLLVVPLALADQWRREIVEKTNLRAYVHHGPKRERDPARLAKWDVVITTYDTVSSEWAQRNTLEQTDTVKGQSVFRVNWWRIVLDEAHTIKNPKAKMSNACCDLSAQYRWCLTGTPYQNTVDDVYSLIRFLRIPPFCDWSYWRERITSQTKNGRMSLALTRLRTLLRAVMLRRTKEILKDGGVILPARDVFPEELEFDTVERKFYDDLLARGQQVIEELKNSRGGLQKNYMCLLTMLLRLRQATDHIDLLKGKADDDPDAGNEKAHGPADDELVSMFNELGIETKVDDSIPSNRERCKDCETNLERYDGRRIHGRPSSKIRRMLEILKTDVDNTAVKTIVFSQFTSMLDLIEPHLRDHNIKFGRYDGKMRKDARDAMLTVFRTTSMPVLLVSLKSGSVGLNLTSASRVIMLDLWWNPAIEEQAIDRVHRIGQTRRVVVHKLTIKNSIDERIVKLQEQKREAAKGALGDGVIRRKGMNANKLSLEDVLFLFSMPDHEPDQA